VTAVFTVQMLLKLTGKIKHGAGKGVNYIYIIYTFIHKHKEIIQNATETMK
jgi:hypothetical protein